MSYCRYCGAKLQENGKFCRACGESVYPLNLPDKSGASAKTARERTNWIIIQLVFFVMVCLGLIAIVVGVWPVFLKSNQGITLNPVETHNEGELVTVGNLRMGVVSHELGVHITDGLVKPSEGATFIRVNFNFKNIGEVQENIPSGLNVKFDYKGKSTPSQTDFSSPNDDLGWSMDNIIFPGVEKNYHMIFEVPKNLDTNNVIVKIYYQSHTNEWRLTPI